MTQVSFAVVTTIMILRLGQRAEVKEVQIARRGTKEIVCRDVISDNGILTISPFNKCDDLVYDRASGPIRVVVEAKVMDPRVGLIGFFYEELGIILLVID